MKTICARRWLRVLFAITSCMPLARTEAQATANALAVAEDAFGSADGAESIGIYDQTSVRGFSLEAAGNYRINGRYFVKNAGVSNFFLEKTIVRIGYNALWLDYPGPSGVVDYRLRDPRRDEPSLLTIGLDSYNQPFAELHFKHRSRNDAVAISAGVSRGFNLSNEQGGEGRDALLAGTIRANLGATRLQLFGGEYRYDRTGRFRVSPSPAAEALPPEIERGRYLGQSWATEEGARRIIGGLGDMELSGGWQLRGIMVFSQEAPDRKYTQLFTDVGSDALVGNRLIVSPEQRSHSYSGELRLGKVFESDALTHAIALNGRWRASRSQFGGERILEGDSVNFGERPAPLDYPDLGDSSATLNDRIDQGGLGITYHLSLADRLKVGGGVLYTDYSKRFTNESGIETSTDSAPWLYNAGGAFAIVRGLEIYGSYSRGLEDAGTAPATAANANAVLDAAIATQKELGLRYVSQSELTMILAGFETIKPQVGIDGESGTFAFLGDVRHRGIETSLSGRPSANASVVAGAVYTAARVSGQNISQGLVGDRPVGVPKWRAVANLNYQLSPRLSVDAGVEYSSARAVRSSLSPGGRQLEVPGATFLDLGTRYRFEGVLPIVLRVQVLNAFDRFAWRPAPGEMIDYAPQRSVRLLATVEL